HSGVNAASTSNPPTATSSNNSRVNAPAIIYSPIFGPHPSATHTRAALPPTIPKTLAPSVAPTFVHPHHRPVHPPHRRPCLHPSHLHWLMIYHRPVLDLNRRPCLHRPHQLLSTKDMLTRHLATHNKSVKRPQPRPQPSASTSGTKHRRAEKVSDIFTKRTIRPTQEVAEDLLLFQEEARPQIIAIPEEDLTAKGPIKWYAIVKCHFSRSTPEGGKELATPFFRSKVITQLDLAEAQGHINEAYAKMLASFEEFLASGSG
ncbi:hypothetical protein JTE90_016592, partial [Oedothorax gibbosus]